MDSKRIGIFFNIIISNIKALVLSYLYLPNSVGKEFPKAYFVSFTSSLLRNLSPRKAKGVFEWSEYIKTKRGKGWTVRGSMPELLKLGRMRPAVVKL